MPTQKTVKPTKQHKERILVEEPPMTFVWGFRTEKADIAFEVLFNKQVRDRVSRFASWRLCAIIIMRVVLDRLLRNLNVHSRKWDLSQVT